MVRDRGQCEAHSGKYVRLTWWADIISHPKCEPDSLPDAGAAWVCEMGLVDCVVKSSVEPGSRNCRQLVSD